MEHKQKRDDLAGRQTRLRPAWRRPAGAQQRRLPLRHKRLAEIIDLAKNLDDPIQHHRLRHSAMAAYLKKPFTYNPLIARKPLIRVTYGLQEKGRSCSQKPCFFPPATGCPTTPFFLFFSIAASSPA